MQLEYFHLYFYKIIIREGFFQNLFLKTARRYIKYHHLLRIYNRILYLKIILEEKITKDRTLSLYRNYYPFEHYLGINVIHVLKNEHTNHYINIIKIFLKQLDDKMFIKLYNEIIYKTIIHFPINFENILQRNNETEYVKFLINFFKTIPSSEIYNKEEILDYFLDLCSETHSIVGKNKIKYVILFFISHWFISTKSVKRQKSILLQKLNIPEEIANKIIYDPKILQMSLHIQ